MFQYGNGERERCLFNQLTGGCGRRIERNSLDVLMDVFRWVLAVGGQGAKSRETPGVGFAVECPCKVQFSGNPRGLATPNLSIPPRKLLWLLPDAMLL